MKILINLLISFSSVIILICCFIGCQDNHPSQSEQQKRYDSLQMMNRYGAEQKQSEVMKSYVSIIEKKLKTTDNFLNYYQIKIRNNGEKIISDIQMSSMMHDKFEFFSGPDRNYHINLKPGQDCIIEYYPTNKLEALTKNDKQEETLFKLCIYKVRFEDGSMFSRQAFPVICD